MPTAILLGLFIAYPFAEGVLLSLSSAKVGDPGEFVGLANFAKLWDDNIFWTSVWNTFWYTGVTTVFKLGLGLWLAMLLNRHFKGKAIVRAFILLPFIIPTVLSTFAWKWMFDPTFSVINWTLFKVGLIHARINWLGDTPWSLILTYPTFLIPFCTWLMMGYFKAIPKELEECARIDGASRWKAMLFIVIPVALPGILSSGIIAFTLSWNEFIYALVFLSSPDEKTVAVGVTSELIRGDVFFWGSLMAGALLGSIPVAIVYSFFVEHYVSGLTGSVKG